MASGAHLPHRYPARPARRACVTVPDARDRAIIRPIAAPVAENPFVAMLAPLKRRVSGWDPAGASSSLPDEADANPRK